MATPARARLVADERAARREPVTARAPLGRTDHPAAIGATDQLADCGHNSKVGPALGNCGTDRVHVTTKVRS
jgi:hypothetical protein